MRKHVREQCDTMINTICQAHEEIEKDLSEKNLVEAGELLVQCQQAAIALGEFIENSEKKRFEAGTVIKVLEDYCEIVYRLYESLPNAEWKDILGKIKNTMDVVRGRLEEIPLHYEAVFLPYQVSMWDSLESVWEAADEDPKCDAFIVPIPFFKKNADGSFGDMQCEKKGYPEQADILSYDEYDFELRCPDMVFIHNPYDEYNNVTSVHPFFYSSNIRKYTDCLVYIPYFISSLTDDMCMNDPQMLLGGLGCPAVFNSNKVILQSEKMRKAAIIALSSLNGEKGKRNWAKIILGIGSPKEDKVRKITPDDIEIPSEWAKRLHNNGNRLPVILYNTGITTILSENENLLNKIKADFDFYQNKQNECVLLWRPHPLLEATLKAMRPQLVDEYNCIKQKYIEQDIGIYDDSTDMNRAIALCDAFSGDFSSVAVLCERIGKPVVYNTEEVLPTIKKAGILSNKSTGRSAREEYQSAGKKIYAELIKEL